MNPKKAIKELEKTLLGDPGNLVARLKLAAALREAGRSDEACQNYHAVAVAYQRQGRLAQAVGVCKSVLEIAPNRAETQALLTELDLALRVKAPQTPAPTPELPPALGRVRRESGGAGRPRDSRPPGGLPAIPAPQPLAPGTPPPAGGLRPRSDVPLPAPPPTPPRGLPSVTPSRGLPATPSRSVPSIPGQRPPPGPPPRLHGAPPPPPRGPAPPAVPPPAPPASTPSRLPLPASPPSATPSRDRLPISQLELERGRATWEQLDAMDDSQTRIRDDLGPTPARIEPDEHTHILDGVHIEPADESELGGGLATRPSMPSRPGDSTPSLPRLASIPSLSSIPALASQPNLPAVPFGQTAVRAESSAVQLFSRFPVSALMTLEPALVRQRAPRGHWLFRQGAQATSMFVVRSGVVRLLRKDPTGLSGAMVEVAQVGAGALLGDISALGGGGRLASAQVLEEGEIDELPLAALDELAAQDKQVSEEIERFALARVSEGFASAVTAVNHLPERERLALAERWRTRRVRGGDTYMLAGGWLIVRRGELELTVQTERGQVPLGKLREGQYVLDVGDVGPGRRIGATATRAGEWLLLAGHDLAEVGGPHPELARELLRQAHRGPLADERAVVGQVEGT